MDVDEVEIIHFKKKLTTNDVLKRLDKKGLRPATLRELLAHGAKNPEEQRNYPIIALGSPWSDSNHLCLIPWLFCDSVRRRLVLAADAHGSKWDYGYRFAAVLKSKTVRKKNLIKSSKRKAK